MKGLFNDGIILDVHVRCWSFQASLKADDLNIDKKDVPEIFSLGRKSMI